MKKLACIATIAAFAAGALFGVAVSQDTPGGMGMPVSKEHQFLKKGAGDWKVTMKDPMSGETMPGGVEKNRMIGEYWLETAFQMDMMGMPFEGKGLIGYDPKGGTYTMYWVDSMSIYPTVMTGKMDEKTGEGAFTGESRDPMGNVNKVRSTEKWEGDDKRVFTMYAMMQDGSEMAVMELTYERE